MYISDLILLKSFEKQYAVQKQNVKRAFLERKNLLLIDATHPLLNNHQLKGKYVGFRSINITSDIRAIYFLKGSIAIFVEIGSHSYLY